MPTPTDAPGSLPPLAELGGPLSTEERDPALERINAILRDVQARFDAEDRFRALDEQLQRLLALQRTTVTATERQAKAAERQAIAAELAAEEATRAREEAHADRLQAAQDKEAARKESLAWWGKLLAALLPIAGFFAGAGRELVRILLLDGA